LATGNEYDDTDYLDKGSILSYGLAIEAEYLVAKGWYAVSGLTYIRKGQFYEKFQSPLVYGLDWLDVNEYVHYLQVPAMVRYRWTWVDSEEATPKSSGVSYYVGGGLGLNVAIATSGKQYNDGGSNSLGSAYFDNLKRFNISVLANFCVEYYFKNDRNRVGLELGLDYHILNDWNFPAGTASHYFTITGGVSYRFQVKL
jgi:hypothetical protein